MTIDNAKMKKKNERTVDTQQSIKCDIFFCVKTFGGHDNQIQTHIIFILQMIVDPNMTNDTIDVVLLNIVSKQKRRQRTVK